ncbi:MAG: methyltransferase domain-containing protein [Bacteroidia bacterium]|nr:methyltransferase domain-containing protein [Bacteroidia bacterium]
MAFYSWFTLPAYPVAQLVIFTVLLLLSVNFFIGNILAKGSQSRDNLVLPYVELVKGGTGTVLDAAMSSYMFDHLGDNRLQVLQETWRVLKPGGRFLLIIMVRGYSSFAMANVLSFAFATRANWRKLFTRSNFRLVDEGNLNFGAYFLIEKPVA